MAMLLWGLLLLSLSPWHIHLELPLSCAVEIEIGILDEAPHGESSPVTESVSPTEETLQPTPTSPSVLWLTLPTSAGPDSTSVPDSTSDTWEDIHGPTLPLSTTTMTASPTDSRLSPTGAALAPEQALEKQEVDSSEEEREGSGCDKATSLEQTHRLADTMMQFTIDLLREMQRDNSKDNVILSPFSIALALSQLALGAANQTEKHLLEALHVEALPCLHQMLSSVRKELTKTVLDMAARIYLQKGFEVKEKFLEDSERFYGAKPETLSGDGEDDLLAINNWVKEATNGQIPSFLTELPQSVVMILLNAVHFQGFWRHKFSPSLTAPDMFRLNDEFMVSVEMMKAQKYPLSWFTLDDLDVQVAKFPFKGNMSFVAIVPNQFEWNITQVLVSLNQAELRSRFPREKPTLVKMPKLHLDYQVELNQALRRLGLGELFSRPDLQHISEGPLFVSSIQHQSALRLAEDGVEASAATGVLMSRSISTFSLNQPFVFIIYEETTGIPIFLGNIQNPNPSAPQQRIEQQDSPDDKNVVQGVIPK